MAFLIGAMPVLGGGFQFPSAGASESPDGKWKIVCKSPTNDLDQAGHLLLLKRNHGATVRLRRFDRGCDILWSPRSSQFALTDRWASDKADVFLCSVSKSQSSRSVTKNFPQHLIPADELRGHCYFEAHKWLNPHLLVIKVSGHTDEAPVRGFEHEYVFDCVSGKFEKRIPK
jgi:hypothetical protein